MSQTDRTAQRVARDVRHSAALSVNEIRMCSIARESSETAIIAGGVGLGLVLALAPVLALMLVFRASGRIRCMGELKHGYNYARYHRDAPTRVKIGLYCVPSNERRKHPSRPALSFSAQTKKTISAVRE